MVWRPEAGIGVPAGAPLPPMPGPASAPRRHAAVSRVVCVSPRLTRPPVTESGSTPIQWDAILWEDSASRCGRHAGVGGEVSACLSGDAPRPPRGASARRTDAGTESAWPRDRAPFPEKLRTCSRRTCSRRRLPAPPAAPARPPRPCPRPAWSAWVLAIPSGVWRRLVGVLIRFSRVACLRRDVACLSRASLPPLCARGGTVSAFARRLAGWLLLVLLTGSLLRITPPPDKHAQGARPVVAARVRSALPGENPSPPPRRQLPSTWTSRPEPSCVCSSRFCLFRGALLSRPWLSSGHSPTGATAELPGEGLPLEDPCSSGGEAGATVTAQGVPWDPSHFSQWLWETQGARVPSVLGKREPGESSSKQASWGRALIHRLTAWRPEVQVCGGRGAAAQGCGGDPPGLSPAPAALLAAFAAPWLPEASL